MAYTTIDDGSAHFHTLLYTGNGSDDRNLTNDANAGDFKPDWLWIKQRSATRGHIIVDSSRGATLRLRPDSNNGEDTKADHIQAFLTNGFQVGTNNTTNVSSGTYVAWQWKANGGTTTTNDASATSVGTIDSVYQANTTAGFSIVTYTGSGSEGTIAHGLGVTPKMIIWKRRTDDGNNWSVQGKQSGINTDRVEINLNSTGAKSSVDSRIGRQSQWSSTVFEVNTYVDQNTSSKNYVAYCFAEKQGYSKFGSYTGNGDGNNTSADGTFVYTGFKPSWVMVKASTVAQSWTIFDNKRDNYNVADKFLYANTTDAETTGYDATDFLSNGFKLRKNLNGTNDSDQTFIYMAFAEHPFVSSKGVPTTAR